MRMPQVYGIRVDVEALLRLRHRHDPTRCSAVGCCCSSYEVCVSAKEVERIAGLLPMAAHYAPHLCADGALDNPFDPIGHGEYALDTDSAGTCVFAYRDRMGTTLCAVHSAALDLGLDPYKMKPAACALWPLALSEDRPPVLTVQDGAYAFPCNRRRSRAAARLDAGVAAIIRAVFGPEFLESLERDAPC